MQMVSPAYNTSGILIMLASWKRGSSGMTTSSLELGGSPCALSGPAAPGRGTSLSSMAVHGGSSIGAGRRARPPLHDLDAKFITRSGLCGSLEGGDQATAPHVRGALKISHGWAGPPSTAVSSSTNAPKRDDSVPRFPRLDQCAHFHYEYVELPPIQVSLVSEELKPLSQLAGSEENENRSLLVQVASLGRAWVVRRTYENFRFLDKQLHRCCYDRKISQLPELPSEENIRAHDPETAVEELLKAYTERFSTIAGSLITCGPVLSWLELDNRGHRLIVTDDSDINTPAVAAAYVIKRYTAQASDEISFEVGDMISVIDMPPPEESIWWRGKRGFQVGFFPCECVQVIGDKVPHSIQSHTLTLPSTHCSSTITGTTTTVTTAVLNTITTTTSLTTSSSDHGCTSQASARIAQEPLKPVLRKHGKLIAFFRSFILSRPSRRKLKQSGILRERVFGCDLGENLMNSSHDIPMVLKCCAQFIEKHGTVDGIYRLSGITSNIQKLRNAFDEERVPDLYGDEGILQDIHCVSSLLKMYFRELPNPLLTYQLYDKFATAVMQEEETRLLHIRDVVQQLPPPHYRTLEYLIRHLGRIASHSSTTGMTPKNIAIVWAPNLLRSKDLEKGGVAALQDVGTQAVVTEYLIRYVELIFNDKFPNLCPVSSSEATHRNTRPKSLAISTPTKLISIDEARSRALASLKTDQNYFEVGGGPRSLPKTYHTIIDLPSRKGGSLKHKKSPSGWKTLFSKSRYQRKASNSSQMPLNTSVDSASSSKEPSHPPKKLRPVKSVESLVSTPLSLHSGSSQVNSQNDKQKLQEIRPIDIEENEASFSTASSPLPSPKTHNRSVSHDSYFNTLERSSSSPVRTGTVKEERESDVEFSPDSPKISFELGLSELNMDFNTSEPEMRIFSEDETLQSTSLDDTVSHSTFDMESISMGSDCAKSKDSLSSREKRSLKEKVRQTFTPTLQRRTPDSNNLQNEESRNNSLKRTSFVIKDKGTHTLIVEPVGKKNSNSSLLSVSPSSSPKIKHKKVSGVNDEIKASSAPLSMETKDAIQDSLSSSLIEPDLLKKITHMRISPSASVSDTSSISLAEATVSDNESFTLGSTSSGALVGSGMNGINDTKVLFDNGSSQAASAVPTPSTLSVGIVTDFYFDQDSGRPQMVKSFEEKSLRKNADGDQSKEHSGKRDRPNSLLGLPTSELLSIGNSLVSPETPQGDSTFLEIQYDPLSDTTEPSTPSESQFGIPSGDSAESIPQVHVRGKQSSPLSPDISSSSTDDPIDNAPMYENIEIGASLPLTKRLLDGDDANVDSLSSNSKPSPEIETPTPADSEYENIQYQNLELSLQFDSDARNLESDIVTPCYENIEPESPQDLANSLIPEDSQTTQQENKSFYENVDSSPDPMSNCAYEEYSFNSSTEYENLEFSKESPSPQNKTEAEIEGEIVYQQVKYLKKTIEEVNVILSEDDLDENSVEEKHGKNQSSSNPLDVKSHANLILEQSERQQSDGSEFLESPITPSSSSAITEMLVLPSFSSPTESTTDDVTSPDASDAHSAPQTTLVSRKLHSPTSPSTSPPQFPHMLHTLSPPSPESVLVSSISSNKNLEASRKDNFPIIQRRPQPKPRNNLPTLNVSSPYISSISSKGLPTSPEDDFSEFSQSNSSVENVSLSCSSQSIAPKCSNLPFAGEKKESPCSHEDCSFSSSPNAPQQIDDNVEELSNSTGSPPQGDSLKRERINKIKEERRSFLRKKFPSESFKGEKDEMILRLKQKATSPSRQFESDGESCVFGNAETTDHVRPSSDSDKAAAVFPKDEAPSNISSDDSLPCGENANSPEKYMRSLSNDYVQNINLFDNSAVGDSSSRNLRKMSQNNLHRSISEDLRPDLPIVKKLTDGPRAMSSASHKLSNVEFHIEPIYRNRKSSSPGQSKDPRDEEVNVKERVAIWSRHEESASHLQQCKPPVGKVEPPVIDPKASSPIKIASQPLFVTQTNKSEKPPLPTFRRSLGSLISVNDKPCESKASSNLSISKLQKVYDSNNDNDRPQSLNAASKASNSSPATASESQVNSRKWESNSKTDKSLATAKLEPKSSLPALIKSAPHSPKRTSSPTLPSLKSEGDLQAPITLRTTRSYSVGSPFLGGTGKTPPPPLLTHGHHKKIKDIAARFEKDSSSVPRPLLRQSSKE